MGKAIAVLGSGSDVGKSLVTAGLCRLFRDAGLDVAPFKAQNMANQAGVTRDGLEMPRAQILQALACGLEPEVDMGPVLMKPVSPTGAQINLLGLCDGWRCAFLNEVRRDRGLPAQPCRRADPLELRIRRWAEHVQAHLRPGAWERLLGAVSENR